MSETSTIVAPAVEPEVSQPDANLLKQLGRVQRERDNVRAVAVWGIYQSLRDEDDDDIPF